MPLIQILFATLIKLYGNRCCNVVIKFETQPIIGTTGLHSSVIGFTWKTNIVGKFNLIGLNGMEQFPEKINIKKIISAKCK